LGWDFELLKVFMKRR